MRRWVYEALYRLPVSIDRVFGSTRDIERLVTTAVEGRVPAGRAVTLGCGVGRESIALARLGFDVTGVDFSPTAIDRARKMADRAGVTVRFVVDDLTDLTEITGTFDLITDFGALSDLKRSKRGLYLQNLLSLSHPNTLYFMFCFRWRLDREDVMQMFGTHFDIDRFERSTDSGFPNSLDCYLMRRNDIDQ